MSHRETKKTDDPKQQSQEQWSDTEDEQKNLSDLLVNLRNVSEGIAKILDDKIPSTSKPKHPHQEAGEQNEEAPTQTAEVPKGAEASEQGQTSPFWMCFKRQTHAETSPKTIRKEQQGQGIDPTRSYQEWASTIGGSGRGTLGLNVRDSALEFPWTTYDWGKDVIELSQEDSGRSFDEIPPDDIEFIDLTDEETNSSFFTDVIRGNSIDKYEEKLEKTKIIDLNTSGELADFSGLSESFNATRYYSDENAHNPDELHLLLGMVREFEDPNKPEHTDARNALRASNRKYVYSLNTSKVASSLSPPKIKWIKANNRKDRQGGYTSMMVDLATYMVDNEEVTSEWMGKDKYNQQLYMPRTGGRVPLHPENKWAAKYVLRPFSLIDVGSRSLAAYPMDAKSDMSWPFHKIEGKRQTIQPYIDTMAVILEREGQEFCYDTILPKVAAARKSLGMYNNRWIVCSKIANGFLMKDRVFHPFHKKFRQNSVENADEKIVEEFRTQEEYSVEEAATEILNHTMQSPFDDMNYMVTMSLPLNPQPGTKQIPRIIALVFLYQRQRNFKHLVCFIPSEKPRTFTPQIHPMVRALADMFAIKEVFLVPGAEMTQESSAKQILCIGVGALHGFFQPFEEEKFDRRERFPFSIGSFLKDDTRPYLTKVNKK